MRNSVMMNSSSESVNANSAPAKTAGPISSRTDACRDVRHLDRDIEGSRELVLQLVVAEHLAVPHGGRAGEREQHVLVRVEAERDEQDDRREKKDVDQHRPHAVQATTATP